jgi:hypothetical protein
MTSVVAAKLLPADSFRPKRAVESLPLVEIVPATRWTDSSASEFAVADAGQRFTERENTVLTASAVDYWFERSPMYRSRSIGRRAISPIYETAAEY